MANNHSRYLGNSGHHFNNEFEELKNIATSKQLKFFLRLRYLCKEHGIEEHEDPKGRVGFSMSIDKLLKLLQEAGVDVKGNGKSFNIAVVQDTTNVLESDTYVKIIKSE